MSPTGAAADRSIRSRLAALDWRALARALDSEGHARSGAPILSPRECAQLAALYERERLFRSRIDMARHRFGEGEYKYFKRPLPKIVERLREELYLRLSPIANAWMEAFGEERRFPPRLAMFLAECAAAGQTKPTPLMLRYQAGGYNRLHQDLYGEKAFPLQAMIPLSRPGTDYAGGEFLLVEQRPRAQSVGTAIVPARGELVVFPNRFRPVRGTRGWYRATVRHGASRVRAGERFALAIIFHDAA
ncbi:MAG TPA: 2OG-Fe(II) oxygenase [Thermoanaerobaculia bacterium]|nr:2OG-Fe(II) oxygenase [Thermoanaerobaculia bacterium]